ncbi:MAG: transketolase [Cyclonatronaceae bacterium]
MKSSTDLDALCINTIRTLTIDAIEKAASGHPGMPMGTAPLAYVLWTRYLRYNPKNPDWPNRDRFVLSAGHGSMLLYSLLHLTGFDLELDELKAFRQLDSRTPGHPEFGQTPGVETTTGPLGQGFGNGVGMAIAQKYLASYFNREDFKPFDYKIYAIVSDGDMMEGVQSETASLAGHLKLDNLIYFYDDNGITIDGSTDLSFSEDVPKRFRGYGWNVVEADGNDLKSIENALVSCLESNGGKPSLIATKTNIGFGSPNKQDTAGVHGAALGEEEVRLTKKNFGFDPDTTFAVPEQALEVFRKAIEKGQKLENEWGKGLAAYEKNHPELYKEFRAFQDGATAINWQDVLPEFSSSDGKTATRKASGKVLEKVVAASPLIIGGSADLTPSNNTLAKTLQDFSADNYSGRYIRYGIREHGMGAIMNGMTLSGLRPYGGTFLIFSDYMRPTIRLAAMMGIPVIYVFTHDSIGLGEDGPTHQPVEHLQALRAIPNLHVIRPADANETAYAWQMAIERKDGPVALILTRQGLPIFDRKDLAPASEITRGAYVMAGSENDEMILIATGSEVQLALGAREELGKDGVHVRVVNMGCQEVFDQQPASYRNSVLKPEIKKRISIEAGVSLGWEKYIGANGSSISLERFGVSAPAGEAMKALGFTVERVVEACKKDLAK